METEGCYNYPETNTSALCTPRVPLSQPGRGKQMYLIFWERGVRRRGVGTVEERLRRGRCRWGGNGIEKIEKGIEKDESSQQRRGEDRDGERARDNEGREGAE